MSLKLAGEANELETHAANAIAHHGMAGRPLISGAYYGPTNMTRPSGGNAPGANTLWFHYFALEEVATFDRIGVNITTAGGGGANMRLGIYNDANGVPGSLIIDGGELDVTTTGNKEAVISASLTKGRYWLALLTNDGTVQALSSGSSAGLPIRHGAANDDYVALSASQAYGALPETAPTAGGNYRIHTVVLRRQ